MIVFPMAGSSRRFSDAGYPIPKYALPHGLGSFLFDRAVQSFGKASEKETVVFVARDDGFAPSFIKWRIDVLQLEHARIVLLDGPTRGQADTVKQGLLRLGGGLAEDLLVFNIDTIRRSGDRPILEGSARGALEVTVADGDHWSFVQPASDVPGIAAQVVEKKRISNLCSTGLYLFESSEYFIELYEATYSVDNRTTVRSEEYIAPMYQTAIDDGALISYFHIDSDKLLLSGTPSEYLNTYRLP